MENDKKIKLRVKLFIFASFLILFSFSYFISAQSASSYPPSTQQINVSGMNNSQICSAFNGTLCNNNLGENCEGGYTPLPFYANNLKPGEICCVKNGCVAHEKWVQDIGQHNCSITFQGIKYNYYYYNKTSDVCPQSVIANLKNVYCEEADNLSTICFINSTVIDPTNSRCYRFAGSCPVGSVSGPTSGNSSANVSGAQGASSAGFFQKVLIFFEKILIFFEKILGLYHR